MNAAVAAFPALMTVDETAELLRTTRKAIYALVERGQLAGVRHLGRRVLIDRDELLSSLAEQRAPSPERSGR
jgi:excisionase family DNA binding protein